jgi:hypothetical protein
MIALVVEMPFIEWEQSKNIRFSCKKQVKGATPSKRKNPFRISKYHLVTPGILK